MNVTAERAHWDAVSADDPATMIRHGNWDQATASDLAHVAPVAENGGPILDLGCGIGRLSVALARECGVNVIGVDVSAKMLNRASSDPRVEYLQGDGRTLPDLPLLAGAFSVLMFQHIPKAAQESYVGQVGNLLQPGATFAFQTVTGTEDVFLSHQVHPFEPADWCEDAGLRVLSVRQGDPSEWQWVTARRPPITLTTKERCA